MYGIFGKPLKRAFQTCMGHGGVGALKKKFSGPEGWQFRNFGAFWQKSGVFFLSREPRMQYPTVIATYLRDEGSNPKT